MRSNFRGTGLARTCAGGTVVSTSADNVQSLEARFAPAGNHVSGVNTLGDSAARLVGLPLTLATRSSAIAILQRLMASGTPPAHWVCFLNLHSFNSAMVDPSCRAALSEAFAVFPDGCAIDAAARLCGLRIPENLPGTDLVPAMLEASAGGCFLIGGESKQAERAGRQLERLFPSWSVVGSASGYLASEEEERDVVDRVNRAKPDLLLIGMGTPLQERFMRRYAGELEVPLCICVGGLFGYWNGRLIRAPRLMRRLRLEWSWILVQQPRKLQRYTLGTVRFFSAVLRHWRRERSAP